VKYIFKRDFGRYISEEYLFQYISERKKYLIQIYVWPEGRINCANIFLEGILEIYF